MPSPIKITMSGYGPPSTGFSKSLKFIGDRIAARFGGDVAIDYVFNIMDHGHKAEDILTLVERGEMTMGYQSSSYLTDRVPELGFVDLPFLFSSNAQARAAMDGALGEFLARKTEERCNYRILGWFENGFRHISNRLRPIHTPADMKGMKIRVLPSKIQERTFQLLGAEPKIMDLSEAIEGVKNGTLDAQENPFFNTVTYGVHTFHKFHTATNHFYLSRPIFLHRPSFDAWPKALQEEMRAAIQDSIVFQRDLHVKEEDEAQVTIRKSGGDIVELTAQEHAQFARAVNPIFGEARNQYSRELLSLVGV